MEYPQIVRDVIDFENDTEICNIGYTEGIINKNRPYRLEVWSSHNITNCTIFISKLDLEDKTNRELKRLIECSGLIEIITDDIYITDVEDSENNIFYSINIPLEEKDEALNRLIVDIKPFDM